MTNLGINLILESRREKASTEIGRQKRQVAIGKKESSQSKKTKWANARYRKTKPIEAKRRH